MPFYFYSTVVSLINKNILFLKKKTTTKILFYLLRCKLVNTFVSICGYRLKLLTCEIITYKLKRKESLVTHVEISLVAEINDLLTSRATKSGLGSDFKSGFKDSHTRLWSLMNI